MKDTPPNDIVAEESIIGCCIQSADAFNSISGKITDSMFYGEMNRSVYRYIFDMHASGKPVNSESVVIGLSEKKIDVSIDYLSRCMNAAPIPKNAEFFADIIIAKYKARELIIAAYNIQSLAFEIEVSTVFKSLVECENLIADVVKGYNSGIDYYTVEKYEQERDEIVSGIPWGYTALDKWCLIPSGRAAYIGSMSNGGKSVFMFNTILSLAKRHKKCAIFTYEDSRVVSNLLLNYLWYDFLQSNNMKDLFPKGMEYNSVDFFTYKENVHNNILKYRELDKVCAKFSQESVQFFDKNINVEQISTYVNHIIRDHKELDVVFLDYLQIIPSADDKDGYLKMKNMVNALNEISRRNNISIVSACQMSLEDKDKEKRDYMRMTRVREAKDIFHSCSVFIGIHNETQFRQEQFGEETVTDIDEGTFDILKNKTMRGVAKKNIAFKLDRTKMKFTVPSI
jgi:replicative DNA helicase